MENFINIIKVRTPDQIRSLAQLAADIWREHYTAIIGREQVEYMLDKFQSAEAIAGQIENEGYEYCLIRYQGQDAGYLALVPDAEERTMLLSKIYVHGTMRGRGLGKQALQFAIDDCRERGFQKLWLTVNKYNSDSIAWYERQGFTNAGPLITDIGGGFVMDDYRMELIL